jgi:hypothetical protein
MIISNEIDHIEHVYKKIVKYVGMFYKLRKSLPVECLKSLYFAFIHSNTLYAIEVYGSHMNELVKLKIVRIMQLRNNRSHVGELHKSFDTLSIFKLRDLQVATFVHKVSHHPIELLIIFWNYFMFNA